MAEPGAWCWADAWVLAAIMLTDKPDGGSLTELVAAADAINHAILLESELEPAVRKLLGVSLIGTRERRFFLTEEGRAMRPATRAVS